MMASQSQPATLLFLGDVVDKKGLSLTPNPQQEQLLQQLSRLHHPDADQKVYFLSGDRDWDNSGKQGKKKVKALEDYLEQLPGLKKSFLPSKGCPGPKVVELNEQLTLIAINSQWFLHPYDRPEAPDTDCKILTEADFWDELEEAIEEAEGRNIIIAAHHPVYSNGQYAGKRLGSYHLIPIFGTFYQSFRQQIGRSSDMSNPRYQHFSYRMRELLHNYSSILYISGHEQDIEALQVDRNYHINSGAYLRGRAVGKSPFTRYRQSNSGLLRLEYFDDGKIYLQAYRWKDQRLQAAERLLLFQSTCINKVVLEKRLFNTALNPCKRDVENIALSKYIAADTLVLTTAGPEYIRSKFRVWAMGEQYRLEWTTPIRAPYLKIGQEQGGLRPYAKGGGLQTHSLKFRTTDGREFAFRSVNKDPVKALNDLTRQTVYRHIVKDLITTQHPYGGLVASKLLDATDILHPRPQLFVMPNDPRLGIFQSEFAGKLGTLEIRPRNTKNGQPLFGNATRIYSSNKMFRAMYKDNDNQIDRQSYARARVFDLFVGDWDRHEDNWKWAGYKEGKRTAFWPIPRDRDHVFSQWEGLIPSIADKVIPNAENFGMEFDNMTQLSFKARHLDRQLGNGILLEEWQAAARYLQQQMTDSLIDAAVAELPEEVQPFSGPEIAEKLKSRRGQLVDAATELYQLLAKEVDVIGSNKREIFVVERSEDGTLLVRMYDRKKSSGEKGKLVYERRFRPEETKEVRLFGLAGRDEFYINGQSPQGPLLRIIGGKGVDQIEDRSEVKGPKHKTLVYDSRKQDVVEGDKEYRILRPAHQARYNNKAFEYNALTPIPKFRISSGNGFGAELTATYLNRGFNKPEFEQKYQAKLIYYPGIQAHRLDLRTWFRHVVGLHDLRLHLRYSSLYDKFPFFYGIGNNSVRDIDLFEDDFYRTDYNTLILNSSLEKRFLEKSRYRIGLQYEFNDISPINEDFTIFNQPELAQINGLGQQHLIGIVGHIDLDFRDHPTFSRYGTQLYLYNELFSNQSEGGDLFGKVEGYLAYYNTVKIGRPLTAALRGGFSQSYGESPFNHLSALGSNAHLRAYVRNRFLGNRSVYFNSELRLQAGTIRTPLFPIKWGLFGFWDTGRVWSNEEESDRWHRGFGGGLFAAPLSENFNFIFTYGRSRDQESYFSVNVGFDLQ